MPIIHWLNWPNRIDSSSLPYELMYIEEPSAIDRCVCLFFFASILLFIAFICLFVCLLFFFWQRWENIRNDKRRFEHLYLSRVMLYSEYLYVCVCVCVSISHLALFLLCVWRCPLVFHVFFFFSFFPLVLDLLILLSMFVAFVVIVQFFSPPSMFMYV